MSRIDKFLKLVDELVETLKEMSDEEAQEALAEFSRRLKTEDNMEEYYIGFVNQFDPRYRGIAAKLKLASLVGVHLSHEITSKIEDDVVYQDALIIELLVHASTLNERASAIKSYAKGVAEEFSRRAEESKSDADRYRNYVGMYHGLLMYSIATSIQKTMDGIQDTLLSYALSFEIIKQEEE